MSSTTSTINLSSLGSAINDVLNIIVQYLPVFVTVAVLFGIITYMTGGLGGLFSGITGIFGS
ncbi:hypothetical protein [Deltalipothrixvirus pozzuoliense]|uniref:Uncharacterized protein ORF61 n=1 Tax=Acidianus filamentous virus 2 (isolate Italy/Pozzuoli) TaxID=654910 RepID=Y061_AFV2P|nr:hypothetical protein AFV2_gp28 [Acidianus filamentous virus 2]Q573E1.1 RecName: Full=Uncharacterized protein ORF61 [Acidianus filamentous virus 2 (isolate Pozzuoli)]CAH69415.1 hypothetical protein [Acidianus filamentous virus 2]